ncbi:putative inactive leucine-rich repeat receptor-like protein kinase [Ananas comosus]|uniref:Putative inactive leucine-rich repeat receptor-like protein kinase n=1 Tax=Ananas comosus TaxID=4615 RepID=A0A199V3X3_ANACO|nr:putative inactive leucine-rich repeat receptor-like protein kinase [Ananas comosus]
MRGHYLSRLLISIIFVILAAVVRIAAALSPDGLSLLALKSAVSDDPSSTLSAWSESDADPCRWPGVSCANVSGYDYPRVVGIAVAGKNLSGYIPSELGSLLFLRRLNLHSNRLSGPIPAELANASSLRSLFLYDNSLSGHFPAALCDLPRLQNLDLSRNSLAGPIPRDLRSCRQLQRLLLQQNGFSGEIPAGIWPETVNLVQLDLSSNQLNGSIPRDLGELDSLGGTLNLSHNRFSGKVPEALGNLPSTVTLDLRYNNLSGEIPQEGSLANQGPTAYLGNPLLCGFPLQVACAERGAPPAPPGTAGAGAKGGGAAAGEEKGRLRTGMIALISAADAAGVAVIGAIVVYVYWRVRDREEGEGCSCTGKGKLGGGGGGGGDGRCAWWCAAAEEAGEEGEEDELDELLRSSAYVLGKGGKGIVYKVVVGSGVPVAVRRLGGGGGGEAGKQQQQQQQQQEQVRYKEFAAEAQGIGRVRHPNVVRLRAYYWAQDEKLLITDFISNGNLAAALRGRSGQPSLSWSNRLRIAKGSARGLAHIHECSPRKFVHGDIKPTNILLDADYNPYIGDFGLSRLIALAGVNDDLSSSSATSAFMGGALPAMKPAMLERPNNYRAPEARVLGVRPTQRWDVYSFGVVLLELLTGRSPEMASPSTSSTSAAPAGDHVPELVRWVRKGFEDAKPLAELVDEALRREVNAKKEVISVFHIALACTEPDPEQRPRMKTVAENLDKVGS